MIRYGLDGCAVLKVNLCVFCMAVGKVSGIFKDVFYKCVDSIFGNIVAGKNYCAYSYGCYIFGHVVGAGGKYNLGVVR